jgi:hypothetical protein
MVIKEIICNLHTLSCISCHAANNLLIQYMEQRRLDRENKNKNNIVGGGGRGGRSMERNPESRLCTFGFQEKRLPDEMDTCFLEIQKYQRD